MATAKQPSKRQDTKSALLKSAQRLIAEKGLASVSVKMITKDAGARNPSAVHYHFGDIEGLIKEVFAERYRSIEAKRIELLAEMDEQDRDKRLLALLEVSIEPFLEACLEEDGRVYVRFCLQFATDPRFDFAKMIAEIGPQSLLMLRPQIVECLKHVPPEKLSLRLRHGFMIGLVQAFDFAAKIEDGTAPPLEEAVKEAASCLCGYLAAP